MADLPRWVWDLLADLLDEEDVHPKLFAETYVIAAGKHQMTRYDWCPGNVLAGIPKDVLDHAKAIAAYRTQVRWADAERTEATREPPADTERTEVTP